MDCLVKLYELPVLDISDTKVIFRRVMAYEKTKVLNWIRSEFTLAWSDECSVAFSQPMISCFIAIEAGKIIGFACYDCTQKNFFGPMGVREISRQKGVGSHLMITALNAMKENGYAYAIIGGCDGQVDYYSSVVGAIPIENSTPGIYTNKLQ